MMIKRIICVTLLAVTSACSTMNFVNGPVLGDTVKRDKWHHLAIVGLVEVSEPFDAGYYCDDKQWEKLTVEMTFTNVIANQTSPPLFSIWTPWTVLYECRESID